MWIVEGRIRQFQLFREAVHFREEERMEEFEVAALGAEVDVGYWVSNRVRFRSS